MWGIIFSCAGYVGEYVFLWAEESFVRDYMYDVSVGVLYWYISVVFGILMEVGDVELGLGLLYSIFTHLYGIHMD